MVKSGLMVVAEKKKPGRPPGSGGMYAVSVRVFEGETDEGVSLQRLVVVHGVAGMHKLQEAIAKAFFPNGAGGSLVNASELELFRKTHGEGLFQLEPELLQDARVTNVFPNGSTMVCC